MLLARVFLHADPNGHLCCVEIRRKECRSFDERSVDRFGEGSGEGVKINYAPNPLCTTIELDERDVQLMRANVQIEELEERVYCAWGALKDRSDIQEAIGELNVEGLEEAPFKKTLDRKMEWLLEALSDKHVGDCTCVPCSCSKCHAESLMGIDTIKGLGKHSAAKIASAFSRGLAIDDVIEHLENYKVTEITPGSGWKSLEQMAPYIPRWTKEAKRAAEWLIQYRRDHFE